MALGRTQIEQVDGARLNIIESCNYVDDCWNTFQYVSNNLAEWADETVIGNELKGELVKLSGAVKELNDITRKFCNSTIEQYLERQRSLNNG